MPLDPMTRPSVLFRQRRRRGHRLGVPFAVALALATPAQPPTDIPAPTARAAISAASPIDGRLAATR
ncbi:MAG: hypothetical protein WCJ69_10050 [Betaproteobacteria bacterium]